MHLLCSLDLGGKSKHLNVQLQTPAYPEIIEVKGHVFLTGTNFVLYHQMLQCMLAMLFDLKMPTKPHHLQKQEGDPEVAKPEKLKSHWTLPSQN